MTPISLEFSGIFSYQKKFTIDFKALSRQGIFGIFGAVGSGKSSIIDAMTFVLYGQYHRAPNSQIHYNLMNLKSNESFIKFSFEHNEKKYMFIYQAQRSKKDHLNITKHERKGYEIIDNNLLPLPKSHDAKHILDLDFDEFIKLVIIPQGQFAEFINLTDGNRTKMMKKILKLEKFSLFQPTNHLLNQSKQDLSYIEGQLSGTENLNDSVIENKKNQILANKKIIDNNILSINILSKSIKALDDLEKHTKELEVCESEYKNLLVNEADFRNIANQITKHQLVLENFHTLYIEIKNVNESINQATTRIKKIEDESAELNIKLQEIQKQKSESLSGFEDVVTYQKHVDKYTAFNSLNNLLSEHKNLSTQLSDSLKNIQIFTEKKNILSEDLIKINDEINKNTELIQQESVIKEQLSYFREFAKLNLEIVEKQELIQEIHSETDLFSNKKNELIKDFNVKNQTEIATSDKISANIHELNNLNISQKEEKKRLESEYAQIQELHALNKFANHLHEGDACPLCGSENHPEKFNNDNISQKAIDINENIQLLNEKIDNTHLIINELNTIIEKYKMKKSESDKEIQNLNNLQFENEQIQLKINGLDENSLKILESEIQQIKSINNEKNNYKKSIELQISELQQAIDKSDHHIIENKINRIQGQLDNINNQFDFEDIRNFNPGVEPEKYIENAHNNIKEIAIFQDNENQFTHQIQSLNSQKSVLIDQLDSNQKKLQTFNNQWNSSAAQLQLSQEDISQVFEHPMNIQNEQEKLNQYNSKKEYTSIKIKELKSLIKDQNYNPDFHQNQINDKEKLESQNKDLNESNIILQNEVKSLEIDWEKKKNNLVEKEKIEKRIDNLNTLLSIFRNENFVQFISKQYTKHLFLLANKRFKKLTYNQLELSIEDDDKFSVVDYMNDKRTRSIKTLSGGQLFQASLCLALALSEQLQLIQNQKQQFFFIDEGFGTLDKNILDIVLETLKQLKSEGRTVGIISHVEELQHEISYNIHVERHSETGSDIKMNC